MVASGAEAFYFATLFMRNVVVFLIHLYRWTLKPFLQVIGGPGSGCRFEPTCSQYALEAVQLHGAWRGSWLAAKRICRCHPWGGSGYDPVPPNFKARC